LSKEFLPRSVQHLVLNYGNAGSAYVDVVSIRVCNFSIAMGGLCGDLTFFVKGNRLLDLGVSYAIFSHMPYGCSSIKKAQLIAP
jgi:hypothetical protein